jgi:hypothetical protein
MVIVGSWVYVGKNVGVRLGTLVVADGVMVGAGASGAQAARSRARRIQNEREEFVFMGYPFPI